MSPNERIDPADGVAAAAATPSDFGEGREGMVTAGRLARQLALETEQGRRLAAPALAALLEARAFRAWIPTRYDGDERTLLEGLGDIERISYEDGSAGWCVMIGLTSALLSGLLDPHWAATVFSDPACIIGGYAMPQGTARVVEGGLEVTGRWSWGSGTDHCTWIGGGVLVVDDAGRPTPRADGLRAPFVLMPAEQVEIVDIWRTSGLRGTASNDYRVEGQFVPEGCWGEFLKAQPVCDGPLYRLPFSAALGLGVACVGLGLARRALDELATVAVAKTPALSSKTLAERATVQADVARAEAARSAAGCLLRQEAEAAWQRALDGSPPTAEQRRRLRLAATYAMTSSADVVDICYHAAGGSAIWEDAALQRCFRDIHVATQHGMVAPRTLEPIGRMRLGLPTDAGQF